MIDLRRENQKQMEELTEMERTRNVCGKEGGDKKHENISNGEMIQMKGMNLILGPILLEGAQQLVGRAEILPERLLNDDPGNAYAGRDVAMLFKIFGDGDTYIWGKG